MRRTNTFAVGPLSEPDQQLLRELLDAAASLWNELNYERRQNFFDGESVWDTADYRKQYVGVLGSATAQQVIRKNSEAWRSFFAAREDGEDTAPPATGATRTTAGSCGRTSATTSTRWKPASGAASKSPSAKT